MMGLFSEKRLFLCSWWIGKKGKEGGFLPVIESIVGHIPEDHFIIFHNIHPKETTLIEWLKKEADNRVYDTVWEREIWTKRFPDIESASIQQVLQTYSMSEKSKEETEKNPDMSYLIWNTLQIIDLMPRSLRNEEIIREVIHADGGGKIFDLIDTINAGNAKKSIEIFRKILETTKIRELLPSLIGLMRNSLYIKYLHHIGTRESEIPQVIKVHPFVLKKTLQSPLSFEKTSEFYKKLVYISKAYKSGKWLQDSELWSIFEIELALMGLKK
jgi:DNA polymerase III delta subunit